MTAATRTGGRATGPGPTTDVTSPDLEALLRVQEHDTAADQLRHRKATLAEQAELDGVRATVAALDADAAKVTTMLAEVQARQAALEADAATVGARVAELERRLYAGTGAPAVLQAIQHEVDQLKVRHAALDDDTIAAMEESEPLESQLAEMAARRETLAGDIARLEAAVAAAQAEIDAELATVQAGRDAAAASIPPDLLERYGKLRDRLGGVGAARLVGNSCSGCHLTVSATELDRLRHQQDGAVATCEQCGRILVP